jgi:Spy/CpxP family protein refolding chaperone
MKAAKRQVPANKKPYNKEKKMKTKTAAITITTLLLAATLVFAFDQAQQSPDDQNFNPHRRQHRQFHRGPQNRQRGPAKMLIRAGDKLELTEDQIAQLQQVQDVNTADLKAHHQKVHQYRDQIQTATMTGDEQAIKDAAKNMADQMVKAALIQAQPWSKIREILTAEQFQKVQQFHQKIEERKHSRQRQQRQNRQNFRKRSQYRNQPEETEEDIQ